VTSDWERLDIEDKVLTILRAVPRAGGPDVYGRPFISVYQLAIEMEVRYPAVGRELNKPLGGTGIGQSTSLVQYLAPQLARQIGRNGADYPIEGAGLSPERLADITFRPPHGDPIRSSNTEARWALSLFRVRDQQI
jgi:hypothetical protein